MDISVVVRAREDETGPEGILEIASVADRLAYPELWIGEGPTWDAFVLATAVGSVTRHAAMTVGPVPVSVRDPATISRGAASVAAVTGRRVGVALGTASVRVVEKLHGRSRRSAVHRPESVGACPAKPDRRVGIAGIRRLRMQSFFAGWEHQTVL
jgi:alkanesulfonate monooxygenase SsuD/methylene tetrahydromethanopterin reductase-like flavin-dependent oxidoreductase (luciferase family)